jgi:hypothetical protein
MRACQHLATMCTHGSHTLAVTACTTKVTHKPVACCHREDEAAMRLTEDTAFKRRVLSECGCPMPVTRLAAGEHLLTNYTPQKVLNVIVSHTRYDAAPHMHSTGTALV